MSIYASQQERRKARTNHCPVNPSPSGKVLFGPAKEYRAYGRAEKGREAEKGHGNLTFSACPDVREGAANHGGTYGPCGAAEESRDQDSFDVMSKGDGEKEEKKDAVGGEIHGPATDRLA